MTGVVKSKAVSYGNKPHCNDDACSGFDGFDQEEVPFLFEEDEDDFDLDTFNSVSLGDMDLLLTDNPL